MSLNEHKLVFAAFYMRYCKELEAYSIKRAEHLAQDILQDALTELWQAMIIGMPIKKEIAFVKTLIRNKSINHFRRLKYQKSRLPTYIHGQEMEQTNNSGSIPYDDQEIEEITLKETVKIGIENLPDDIRTVALLVLEGKEQWEIAKKLGVDPRYVKNAWERAKYHLRNGLIKTFIDRNEETS